MLSLQGKLRTLTKEKEKDDAEAADTIRRLQTALAQMTQAHNLPKSKVKPRDTNLVGEPYNCTATFYRKLNEFEDASLKIADQNTTRAQQLSDGLAKRMRVDDPNYCEVDSALADAVGEYLELVLSEGKAKGRRTNFQNVCLDNIHNILALATKKKGATQVDLAKRTGTTRQLIASGVARIKKAVHDLKGALIRFRGAVRCDKLDSRWEEHASKFWTDESVSRPS